MVELSAGASVAVGALTRMPAPQQRPDTDASVANTARSHRRPRLHQHPERRPDAAAQVPPARGGKGPRR